MDFTKIIEDIMPKKVLLEIDGKSIIKSDAEHNAQPYKTNFLLEDLLKSQTSKKVNYWMLVIVTLTFLVSVWAILRSYGLF